MTAGHRVGKIFIELDLDPKRYMRSQQTLLKEAQHGAKILEKNFKNLGIKSGATFDLMRAQAEKAFETIKKSGRATTDDLIRAEKAKVQKIKQLNEQQYGHTTSMFQKIKKNWMAVSAAIIAGYYAIRKVISAMSDVVVTMAARYETLGIVMRVVGNTAGYTNKEMLEFQKGLEKTGISAIEARQSLVRMNQAQLDLSQSSKLARVAQDAAVIGAMNSSQAFNQMVYGIQSANVRVLRTIGINVSFENSYKKIADQLGVTTTSFTETEKANIRMNAVLEAGETIAGTYEAAMETAGKQLLSLKRHTDNLKVSIGALFTPALAEIVETITSSIVGMNKELGSEESIKAINDWGVNFRITLIDIQAEIMRLAMLIDKAGGTLSKLAVMGAATGAGWGVKKKGSIIDFFFGSKESYEEALAWNLELENRYLATDKALFDLAEKRRLLEESLTEKGKARAEAVLDAIEEQRMAAAKAAKEEKAIAEAAAEQAKFMLDLKKDLAEKEAELLEETFKEQEKYIEKGLKAAEKAAEKELAFMTKYKEDWLKKEAELLQKSLKERAEHIGLVEDLEAEPYDEKALNAIRNMYVDMTDYSQGYFDTVFKLIELQGKAYAKLTEDIILAEAWMTSEKQKAVDARAKIQLDSLEKTMGDFASFFEYLGRENAKYFQVFKALAIAQAAISTYQSAVDAYKAVVGIIPYGPVLAPIAAAAAVAAGLANIARIKDQTFAGHEMGGWLDVHKEGGVISGGSGTKDDVFLGNTGGVNHWGMGGEAVFILNKEAVKRHGALLEAMNNKGWAEGGWVKKPTEDFMPGETPSEYIVRMWQEAINQVTYEIDRTLGLISPLAQAYKAEGERFDRWIDQLREAGVAEEQITEILARKTEVLDHLIEVQKKTLEEDLTARMAKLILDPTELKAYESTKGFIEIIEEIKEWSDITGESYDELIQKTIDVHRLEMKAAIEQSAAAKELQAAANEWTKIADSLDKNIFDLQTSLASPENALQRMQRVWDEIIDLEAAGADTPEEIKKLQDLYNQYLDFAQEAYQRPSSQYQAIYDTVIGALTNLRDDAEAFASSYELQRDTYITEQEQLLAQQNMEQSLQEIATNIMAGIPVDLHLTMDDFVITIGPPPTPMGGGFNPEAIHDYLLDWIGGLSNLLFAQKGGVFTGPESGYPVMLHGTELVTPLDNARGISKDYPELNLTINVNESKTPQATGVAVVKAIEGVLRSDRGRKITQLSARKH